MTVRPIAPEEYVPTADQRVLMRDAPWSHYEDQLALRGEAAVPRISYLDGEIEVMSPSREHERLKSFIGRLIETYAVDRGIELSAYGSWTLRSETRRSGVEPDECYLIGTDQSRDTPDLVIEVIWTSGGIDKLEAYRRLGVPEVWFWKAGTIAVHILGVDGYRPSAKSGCLADLDLKLLCSFLDRPTVTQAIRAFRAALGGP